MISRRAGLTADPESRGWREPLCKYPILPQNVTVELAMGVWRDKKVAKKGLPAASVRGALQAQAVRSRRKGKFWLPTFVLAE
jgi:hypothetical protein